MRVLLACLLVSLSCIAHAQTKPLALLSACPQQLHKRRPSAIIGAETQPVVAKRSSTVRSLAPVLAASFCAAAIMYPLDLVRALQMANAGVKVSALQLLSNFRKTHGVMGFFTQGLAPELARATWMRTVKFGLFPVVHLAIAGVPENKGTGFTKAIAAILTAIPEVITIMPLEIAKISLQLDSEKVFGNSMGKALRQVYKERGLGGFYVGYFGVQCRNALWGAGYFTTLEFFETRVELALRAVGLDPSASPAAKTLSQLTAGFCAGVFGAFLNTPMDTIRSNVQKRILGGLPGPTSFLAVGQEIIAARGATALYAGFGSKAVHLGGGGALMAFFIPFFKKVFENM